MAQKNKSGNILSGSMRAGIAVVITVVAVLLCALLLVVFFKSALLFGALRWLMLLLTVCAALACVWLCGRYLDSL
ncbi:MAG: hypothetical protein IJP01_02740 [Oscillospiraceae bacterium]|nr:hypothetical protein [Oscillospiraceae bacterium]